MKMQKGLCIELNDEFSIFLAPNGEFVQGKPVRETAVGEQGYFYPKQAMAVKKTRMIKPVWAPVFAALAVAVLFLSVLLPKQEAFAYIQVQVNPGIELGIDDEYEVISVRGLNADGRELISEIGAWKHHQLEEVLNRVIELSLETETDEITITTVADEEEKVDDEALMKSVTAISTKVVAENITVRLKEASKKQWRTSVEKKVPVGHLINHSEKLEKGEPATKPAESNDKKPIEIKEQPSAEEKVKKQE
ncbi:anti-sigma-I factor RsgI family protein, partial [Planococcus sp. CAU13]|uniref:anti-sigma-I factor RsgI family protein n=1 Tax=Planococcus sp. CAU13 TaxID=1541197 RepID=UPI00052FFA63